MSKKRKREEQHQLVEYVIGELEKNGDEDKSIQMAKYLKTEKNQFFGVQSKPCKVIAKDCKNLFKLETRKEYEEVLWQLFSNIHRECKYIALEIAKQHKQYITLESLPLFEKMIREGAWWDSVDLIASWLIGGVVRSDPDTVWPIIDKWIEDDDMWIRRAALICQLQSKEDTDEKRLYRYCLKLAHEKEFFIRKAIGWCLRQYARVDPNSVTAFLEKNRKLLSPLSFREAAKHLSLQ